MTFVIHALAAAAALLVVVLALLPGRPSLLRLPLGLAGAQQLLWSLTAIGDELTHAPSYALLSAVVAPLLAPLILHFVLAFVGKRVRFAKWLVATYAVFGLESLAIGLAAIAELPRLLPWASLTLLITCIPVTFAVFTLVVQHLRRAGTRTERQRAWLMLFALVLLAPLLPTDLLADAGVAAPRLSTLGSLFFNVALTQLMLGTGLLRGKRSPVAELGFALLTALALLAGYLSLYAAFGERQGVLIIALGALLAAISVPVWLTFSAQARARAGLERFATLGRFSAQMAHDLRNPLAAAQGAAEFLVEEQRRAGRDEGMAVLVVQQLQRLGALIARYQQLADLRPRLQLEDLNALVTRVLSLQQFAAGENIIVKSKLSAENPRAPLDAELVASALENLVKNAIEALPAGGAVTVRTELSPLDDVPRVVLSVQDTGTGIDARVREQLFEPFFTTKTDGSGLGLAFVRGVARAHGGDATLSSEEGRGTTVSLWLPLETREGALRD